MIRKILIAATLAVIATPSIADIKIDRSTLPKGFKFIGVIDEEDARKCDGPRKLVITNRCKPLPNGNKFCAFDCVPEGDPRPRAK